jgi:X-Pro dipeptidyl-peptidase
VLLVLVGVVVWAASVSYPGAQASGLGTQPAQPVFENGQAQIVPAFEDREQWIRERLWVETEVDSDGDKTRDRVHVDVARPRQTETEGLKVPVVYESSPYFAGTSGNRNFLWNVNQELGADPPPRASQPEIEFRATRERISTGQGLVNTWVPRGFAVVHSEATGTGLSTGCPTVGGPPEELAPKAVIDWLNGRAKGYTTVDGTEEVVATWTTGKVGMTGTSYNGTIPLAAATTGVEGLEAIIPIAPNTSYYHYYRSNGLIRHPGGWLGEDIDFLYDFVHSQDPARRAVCNTIYRDGQFAEGRDRATGDYNTFWAERDLLNKVRNVKAAVLMAHAFNDWNVVPEHSVRISAALKGRVPLMQYFHQGGHGGAPPMELMNKWFTRYLYGIENGIEKEPRAWIVREAPPAPPGEPAAGRGRGRGRGRGNVLPPTPYDDYPNPKAADVRLRLMPGGNGIGGLEPVGRMPAATNAAETLVDNVEFAAPALALAAESPHRLLYATPELTAPVHISGTARITITVASSTPAANLSVYLVQLPWTEGPIGTANLITRGWADPQNHRALGTGGNFNSMTRGQPLTPGQNVELTFDFQPDDQIVPAGKRIGLMIFSSDRDFTLWPKPGTVLTVDINRTRLSLPVVGGDAAFTAALPPVTVPLEPAAQAPQAPLDQRKSTDSLQRGHTSAASCDSRTVPPGVGPAVRPG